MLEMPLSSSTFRINKKGINHFVSKAFRSDLLFMLQILFLMLDLFVSR